MNKILIIDDDVKLTGLLEEFFASHKFKTKAIHDPMNSIEVIDKYNPDLIILDLNFFSPNREGELQIDRGEAILEFRQISPKLLMTPVIVCTAEELKNTKTELELKGANKFITKPIKPQVLIAKILILLNDFTYQCMQ